MSLVIAEFTEEMTGEVVRFKERLRAGGIKENLHISPIPKWLPKGEGRSLFQERYLVLSEDSMVRGSYFLKHQEFRIGGQTVPVGYYHEPFSEGLIDRAYQPVGLKMLLDALKRQPLLYCLGMGGFDEALPRMLAAMGWSMSSVPFFFRVARPFNFLRNIVYLRRSTLKRALFDVFAFSGLGWLGIKGLQAFQSLKARDRNRVDVEVVDAFSEWADVLWEDSKHEYRMSAERDAATLNLLYPEHKKKFIRMKMSEGRRTIGWAICLNTRTSQHKQFGTMQLGSIVDCFASLANAEKVVRSATAILEKQGVDLIVSNQAHAAWGKALSRVGFMQGPSNFVLGASKELTRFLKASDTENDAIHLNRGDGEGPSSRL